MEEGGPDNLDWFFKRIQQWESKKRPLIEDIVQKARREGWEHKYFLPTSNSQNTWRQLIRVWLTATNTTDRAVTMNDIKKFQRANLGRFDPNSATILELSPLPSPSTRKWIYSEIDLLEFQSRAKFIDHYAPYRVEKLKSLIETHKPKAVILYGFAYTDWWKKIAAGAKKFEGFYGVKTDLTTYAIMKHPTSMGITNKYFNTVGLWLKSKI